MLRPNLEVDSLEVTLSTEMGHPVGRLTRQSLLDLILLNLVEALSCGHQLWVRCMHLLARRHLGKLALHHSEHLSHRQENALSEFILVVNEEPPSEHLCDVLFEYLRDLEFDEGLLGKDSEFLSGFWLFPKLAAICGLVGELAEHCFSLASIRQVDVCRGKGIGLIVGLLFEAFQSPQIDNGLNHVQSLDTANKIPVTAPSSNLRSLLTYLLVLFGDPADPVEEFGLELWLHDFFNYLQVKSSR